MSLPKLYQWMTDNYPELMKAVEDLGKAAGQGPLDNKTSQLIQLAAAVAGNSEGAVHSHARRAIEAGAAPEEVRHAVLLLASTLGFPTAARAMSWVNDVLGE